jgi:hypothetical protein
MLAEIALAVTIFRLLSCSNHTARMSTLYRRWRPWSHRSRRSYLHAEHAVRTLRRQCSRDMYVI